MLRYCLELYIVVLVAISLNACKKDAETNKDINTPSGLKPRNAIITKAPADRDISKGGSTIVADSTLMAYYPFDGNANNYAGRTGFDAFIGISGPINSKDRFGVENKALLFDGQNSRYSIEANDTVVIPETLPGGLYSFAAQAVTFSAWLCYFDEDGFVPGNSNRPGTRYIFQKGSKNGANLSIYIYGKNEIRFAVTVEGSNYYSVSTVVPEYGKWFHLVAQYNKNSNLAIFINNELKNTVAIKNQYLALPSNMSKQILTTIGSYKEINTLNGTIAFGYIYDGMIDDVRIYSKALSDNEISLLYHEYGY